MSTKKKKKFYGLEDMEKDFGRLTFARLIESQRKCEEISQKDFAKILGITPASLCDLEKGRKIPSPERAAKMAKILGLSQALWVQIALEDQLSAQGLGKFRIVVSTKEAS